MSCLHICAIDLSTARQKRYVVRAGVFARGSCLSYRFSVNFQLFARFFASNLRVARYMRFAFQSMRRGRQAFEPRSKYTPSTKRRRLKRYIAQCDKRGGVDLRQIDDVARSNAERARYGGYQNGYQKRDDSYHDLFQFVVFHTSSPQELFAPERLCNRPRRRQYIPAPCDFQKNYVTNFSNMRFPRHIV